MIQLTFEEILPYDQDDTSKVFLTHFILTIVDRVGKVVLAQSEVQVARSGKLNDFTQTFGMQMYMRTSNHFEPLL